MNGKVKKVIICMTDEWTKKLTKELVERYMRGAQVIDGTNDQEIFYYLQKLGDDILLIFDRLFMGFILKYKIMYLRSINQNMKIIYCECGNCITEFGLRLWELGVDGFICGIEKEISFPKAIDKICNGDRTFPEIISDMVKSGEKEDRRRNSLELTDSEYLVGMYMGKGYNTKEISGVTGLTIDSVRTLSSTMKRKIGYKGPNDLIVLNQRLSVFDVRSWAC